MINSSVHTICLFPFTIYSIHHLPYKIPFFIPKCGNYIEDELYWLKGRTISPLHGTVTVNYPFYSKENIILKPNNFVTKDIL